MVLRGVDVMIIKQSHETKIGWINMWIAYQRHRIELEIHRSPSQLANCDLIGREKLDISRSSLQATSVSMVVGRPVVPTDKRMLYVYTNVHTIQSFNILINICRETDTIVPPGHGRLIAWLLPGRDGWDGPGEGGWLAAMFEID